MPKTEAPATLQWGTTTYQVERVEDTGRKLEMGLHHFRLHGPRGAVYFTMRNQKNPRLMFLVNERRIGGNVPFEWLLENEDGSLEPIR